MNKFYSLLYSGEIPLGYRLKAQLQCDEVHKIPIMFTEASNDYPAIYSEILSFIGENEGVVPPIFVQVG